MTLEELIKKKKFTEEIYLSLHDASGHRFYGAFVKDPSLLDYFKMEIGSFSKFSETSNIWIIEIPSYQYPLGLDSMRVRWEKEKKSREARVSREEFDELTKKKGRTRCKNQK